MNSELYRLVSDYQSSVREAIILLRRAGIRMPLSDMEWINDKIPPEGELGGGVRYRKSSGGCMVTLAAGEVDFDFGQKGDVSGFDFWKLTLYWQKRSNYYNFLTEDELRSCVDEALVSGVLRKDHLGFFYVANTPPLLAFDIDPVEADDLLPYRHADRVLTLFSHYFQAADLMRDNRKKLLRQWEKTGKLSDSKQIELRTYFTSWLGFLAVVCEGFKRLNLRILLTEQRPESFKELTSDSDRIGRLINLHHKALKRYRNDVFHLRPNLDEIRSFFYEGPDRVIWADELHELMARFFSGYRVLCEVHYMLHGRSGEGQIGGFRPRKRNAKASTD